MQIIHGNLFDMPKNGDAICVTTNGMVKRNGHAVMGKGIALDFARVFPDSPELLGQRILKNGNHAYHIQNCVLPGHVPGIKTTDKYAILSFPTKNDWRDKSDINLIAQSCNELVKIADEMNLNHIYFPLPGCNNGGLRPAEVMPVISGILDDRFILVLL